MSRHRLHDLNFRPCAATVICLIATSLLLFSSWRTAWAQNAVPAALQRSGPITPEERAELYQTLRRHAAVLEAQAAVVKSVAKLIGPTVAYIEADVPSTARNTHSRRHVEEAGSGVTILWKGKHYVLTNRHVIRYSSLSGIKITLADGRMIHPLRVWTDPDTDIGVMLIEAPNLVAAELGDSDKLETGDFVLAVGSPFGLTHSVTYGIISAKGRRDLQLDEDEVRYQDFLQTDAAINPGNSGGPLINLRGEVVGINTAIASDSGVNEGIGFAIPINMFMIVGRQLIEHGKVSRAFLGVSLDRHFGPALAAEIGMPYPTGARITRITPKSPAVAASLQVGDVVLEFNGIPIEDDAHLVNVVSLTRVGKKIPLLVYRDRKTITIEVEVGDRSKFQPER